MGLKPFYVYMLIRPNGDPFYVGMGSGARISQHEKRARKERSYKASVIRSIWASGQKVGKTVVERFETAAEAKAFEVALIKTIGRKDLGNGPLANLTDGGDGANGWSTDFRIFHGSLTAAGMASNEVRQKCREHMARCRSIPEWAAQRARELREYWSATKNRRAQSERVKRYFADPVVREEHAARQRLALGRPEVREKMRLAKLGKKQSPEHIAKRLAGKKAAAAKRAEP